MRWPEKGSVLAAAWFATILCVITLASFVIPFAATSPAIPFFSFLPVVFFMLASEHEKARKTIRELRERVEALEASARVGKGPTPAA